MRYALRSSFSRWRGIANSASPAVPRGAPSGRARSSATSASACEQNHFSPWSRQTSPSRTAMVSIAPTSDPPARSVMNWVPFHNVAMSCDVMRGRSCALSSSLPKRRIKWMEVSVTLTGHINPNSAWVNRYW